MDKGTGNVSSGLSFFTFATGKKYLGLAFALARSYKFHNDARIPFCIISNTDFALPWDLKWVQKKIVAEEVTGKGLGFKLQLLELAITDISIFIDADSLIYGDISFLFSKFNPATPNVIGLKITNGTWVDEDVKAACAEFNLKYMIRYCGALYYLVKNTKGYNIFNYANELNVSTRQFQRNANTIYDEPILSIALSEYGVEPLTDDGNIWGDLVQFNYNSQLNIFNGLPQFSNNPNSRNYKFWLPDGNYSPIILHVGSGNYNKKPWLFDALRLKLHYKFFFPKSISNALVVFFVIPLYSIARKILRP